MSTSYGPQLAAFGRMVAEAAKKKINKRAHAELLRKAYAKQGTHSVRSIDPDEYPKIRGMEGPFQFKKGHVLYYDPREGKYYDKNADRYLGNDEATQLTMSTEYFDGQPLARNSDLAHFNRMLVEMGSSNNAAIDAFLQYVRTKRIDSTMELGVLKGKKYWKLYKMRAGDEMSKSAYGFINPATGDLLKADSWKRPAKGIRGNVNDKSTWDRAGKFSIT